MHARASFVAGDACACTVSSARAPSSGDVSAHAASRCTGGSHCGDKGAWAAGKRNVASARFKPQRLWTSCLTYLIGRNRCRNLVATLWVDSCCAYIAGARAGALCALWISLRVENVHAGCCGSSHSVADSKASASVHAYAQCFQQVPCARMLPALACFACR